MVLRRLCERSSIVGATRAKPRNFERSIRFARWFMTRLKEPLVSKVLPPPSGSEFIGAVGVFVAVVTVYSSTMQRSVAAGDAGELAAAACSFSLPHPTGYPLFVLLYGLVVRLGLVVSMRPAVALNAFSSVLGGAAAGVLQYVIQRLTRKALLSSCGRFRSASFTVCAKQSRQPHSPSPSRARSGRTAARARCSRSTIFFALCFFFNACSYLSAQSALRQPSSQPSLLDWVSPISILPSSSPGL